VLLYIHVPFCRQKCGYCAFFSRPLPEGRAGARLMGDYLSSLLGELRFWVDRLGAFPVESVFFGGGTPSLLPARAVAGVLERVAELCALSPSAEITVEANPESALEDGWLFAVRESGVNRLSLGVQSLDDRDLALLGRRHDARMAEAAFATARAAGFSNVSLDFMWGLAGRPGRSQSQSGWLRQLRKAVALQPEHISAYGLTPEADSPLERALAAGDLELPPERVQASMYLAGADFLEGAGYMQYEISNFARLGYACRHNIGYWEGRDYLGLGPAAASTLHGRRWTNPADLSLWREAVRSGAVGGQAEELGEMERLKELLMLRLRMSRGLSLKEWKERSGRAFGQDFARLAHALRGQGLASVREGFFRLTRSGMLVSDTILAHCFRILEQVAFEK
jgi:oxygen-independent coproporphyrinogen-3 oxidase